MLPVCRRAEPAPNTPSAAAAPPATPATVAGSTVDAAPVAVAPVAAAAQVLHIPQRLSEVQLREALAPHTAGVKLLHFSSLEAATGKIEDYKLKDRFQASTACGRAWHGT